MAIDWTRGYSCEWRAFLVDPRTWADTSTVRGLESLSVERSCDGDAPLLESASLRVGAAVGGGLREGYWRVAMTAAQGGEAERVDVCTVLVSSSRGTVERAADALEVTGRSVLYPASVALLPTGSYAPAGVDAVTHAATMLRGSVAAPVETTGAATLDQHVVFDPGSSVLSAVWLLLRACGHTLRIGGDGRIRVLPVATEPALSLGRARARLLHPGIGHELDWTDVPNRYVAVDGAEVAEALNDDPASPTGVPQRGYRHDVVDASPVRVGGETLAAYAARRLAELSVARDSRSYVREWWPGVLPGDLVRASLVSVGMEGDMRVTRQSLSCGAGIVVSEQAEREVRSWPTS